MRRESQIERELPARVVLGADLPAIADARIDTELCAHDVDRDLAQRERRVHAKPGVVVDLIDEHRVHATTEHDTKRKHANPADDRDREREAPVVLAGAPDLETRHEPEQPSELRGSEEPQDLVVEPPAPPARPGPPPGPPEPPDGA